MRVGLRSKEMLSIAVALVCGLRASCEYARRCLFPADAAVATSVWHVLVPMMHQHGGTSSGGCSAVLTVTDSLQHTRRSLLAPNNCGCGAAAASRRPAVPVPRQNLEVDRFCRRLAL